MKILITYEKRDILRLIQQDLDAREIKVKAGTNLEYKGALAVKLEVEADEEEVPAQPPAVPVVEEKQEGRAVDPQPEVDMSAILKESNRVVRSKPAPFPERVLGPNESYEYPKD